MRGTPPPPGSGPGKEFVELNSGDNFRSAICGQSYTSWTGVWGVSSGTNGDGVLGEGFTGLHGRSTASGGQGVLGEGIIGVRGVGSHTNGEGVVGDGKNGVHGISRSPSDSGVWGENTGSGYGVSGSSASGVGVYGSGKIAGKFDGNVIVTGSINDIDLIDLSHRLQLVELKLADLLAATGESKVITQQQLNQTQPNVGSLAEPESSVKVQVNSLNIGDILTWKISGARFPPGGPGPLGPKVKIVIVNEAGDYHEEIVLSPNKDGVVDANVPVVNKPLPLKQQLFFACTINHNRASDLTGFRWSVTSLVEESDFGSRT